MSRPRPSAKPPRRIDVTAYLTLWLILIFGVNAEQVVPGFGAIGTPAMLVALPTLVAWLAARTVPTLGLDQGRQPIRVISLLYCWYMLVSFAVAHTRTLSEIEVNGATRAAIGTLALTGIALIVADGITDRSRFITLMRRLVIAAAAMASVGIAQFFTGASLTFTVPGLQWNHTFVGVGSRSLFNRPFGTATHPIEFSVVAAAVFPLAIHFAMRLPPGTARRNATALACLIGLAVPLSISRSGIVTLLVVLLVLGMGWTWRERLQAALLSMIVVPVLWVVIPGLVGTLRSMFTGFETDDSVQARIERIPRVMEHIRDRPWLGRGHGTFNVEEYFLIDNSAYGLAIETGFLGLFALTMLIVTAAALAIGVRHRPFATEDDGSIGQALAAGVLGIFASLFTFDAMSFDLLSGTLFLMIGAIGALWRITGSPHGTAMARRSDHAHVIGAQHMDGSNSTIPLSRRSP
jgi:hypothetical protein